MSMQMGKVSPKSETKDATAAGWASTNLKEAKRTVGSRNVLRFRNSRRKKMEEKRNLAKLTRPINGEGLCAYRMYNTHLSGMECFLYPFLRDASGSSGTCKHSKVGISSQRRMGIANKQLAGRICTSISLQRRRRHSTLSSGTYRRTTKHEQMFWLVETASS